MKSSPLITIITPIYNAEKYLGQCIESVLSQTYTKFELILVNDGSTDNSTEICNKYASIDSRIKVFNKENGGASSARNLGIENAKGDWITFCDADDFVYPNWLLYFIENVNDYDMIVQGMNTDKPLVSTTDKSETYTYGIDYSGCVQTATQMLFEHRILGYAFVKLFKASIIKTNKLLFNTSFKLREDEEFIIRYLTYCKNIKCVSVSGYFYFVPNWGEKYKNNPQIDLPRSLYLNSKLIFHKGDKMRLLYLQEYFMTLLSLVKLGRANRDFIILFRKDTKDEILSANIFYPSKFIIWLDVSVFFSFIFLQLHSKLK